MSAESNTPRVLLASRNAKKLVELRRILAPLVEVEVLGLDEHFRQCVTLDLRVPRETLRSQRTWYLRSWI